MRDTFVSGAASKTRRYAVALLAVAVAFALTQALWPWVAPHPTPLFLAAVMLSALYAGLGPSLLATALAALVVDYFFIPPTAGFELSVDNAVRTGVFVAVALLISWIDAARKRAEAELRRHAMQQAAVAELGQRALSGAYISGLMDNAVSVLARRLGAESAALWEFCREDNSLWVRACVGWTEEFAEQATADAGPQSMPGRALYSTEPIIFHNTQAAPRLGEPSHLRREARSCVSVAVAGSGEPFGVLSAYSDSPGGFTAEDVHFVQAVANVLSAAVERARGEEERARLLRAEREARSCVSVAVAGSGEPFGVLSAYTDSPSGFTAEDVHFVQAVANVLSAAIERARGEEERARLLRGEQEARREAEEASRAKDEFLAAVSHELRTPLGVILGWAKLLREDDVDEQTRTRALEMIERNAELQKRLIEDLIDISRVVAGKLGIDSRPTELAPVIEDAVAAVALSAKTKGIRIHTEYCGEAGAVLGDPDRLQQVFWNLLSNAVKFTPEGGRVRVWLDKVGASARITVSDTGRGISPDLLPHVFERFRQGESAGVGKCRGLGLGLSIVRHLVEAHGGTVEAASPGEGRGATFRVHIPLAPAGEHLPPVGDGEVMDYTTPAS